jgi:hypothetical protein
MSIDKSASQHDASQTLSVPVIEAQQIVLRDSAGNVRAQFGVGPDGEAQLRFWNAQGKNRVAVGVCQVPGLWLFDNDGRPRVELRLDDASDYAGLHLMDEAGGVRAILNFGDGKAQVQMFDAQDRQRVAVISKPSGDSLVAIYNTHENVTVGLVGGDGMAGTLQLSEAAGQLVGGIQLTDAGKLAVMVESVDDALMAQADGTTPHECSEASHKVNRPHHDFGPSSNN